MKKRIWLSGLTAAKKMLATRWKPSHTLSLHHWWNLLLDILALELSVARSHGAKGQAMRSWSEALKVTTFLAGGGGYARSLSREGRGGIR